MSRRKLLFIDRDGTLIREPEDEQVDAYDKLELVADVINALRDLAAAGYEFVMVSNQDGLGTPAFPQADFDGPHGLMRRIFASQGIEFRDELICPHLPADGCECRKPRTALARGYLADDGWSRARSAVIGDRDTDLEFARNLGVDGILIGSPDTPGWNEVAARLLRNDRRARVVRKTNETDIEVSVDLDGAGPTRIETGIGFFDHMLEQLAKHGGFALDLRCRGDLHIDEHHTVEDCALALGAALAEAVGDKRGIGRYGFVLPMDESLAQAAVDLSGRAYAEFSADIRRESVGGLPTEMVRHFFASLAAAMAMTLHVRVTGDNAHHMVEAAFKSTGRALRQAFAVSGAELPSTKGTL